jgi:hypothetical protein
MVPTIRKPRWTPDISVLSPEAAARPARPAITPRGVRDEVAGEIVAPKRRGA